MSFEYHKKGMCDRCGKRKEKWKVPFLYMDYNDVAHPNEGDGYRQYYLCDKCKIEEEKRLDAQSKSHWNEKWKLIKE